MWNKYEPARGQRENVIQTDSTMYHRTHTLRCRRRGHAVGQVISELEFQVPAKYLLGGCDTQYGYTVAAG